MLSFVLIYSPSAKENREVRMVKQYCKNHYNSNHKVKFISSKNLSIKKLKARKKKRIIYVEVVKSISHGKYGIDANGYYIAYNKKVKKGKKVKSYCIYNPKTNYFDDVIAVIDNGKIR